MSGGFDWVTLVTQILAFVIQLLLSLADIFGW